MNRILAAALALGLAACDRDQDVGAAQADPSQLVNSSGEVSLADGSSMSFSITSERYKQWDQARRSFPKSLITRFGQVLQPRSPTERSITNAIALLESNAQARSAIENAGLSVRGFVELTVALEQQMMLASGDGRPEPPPMPEGYPMTMDTTYYPSYPYPLPPTTPAPITPMPVTPMPVTPMPENPTPVPTYPALPPNPTRDTLAPRDTLFPAPRRDTVLPRRDSQPIRRESIAPSPSPTPTPTPVPPPRRDSTVDTSRAAVPSPAPDTLRRW